MAIGFALVIWLLAVIPAAGAGPAGNGLIVYSGITTENAKPEIYAFPVDGGRRVNLSHDLGWDYMPALSPDGTRIVFWRDTGDWIVARADGADQVALAQGKGLRPVCWAADSRHLAGSMSVAGVGSVVIVDVETSMVRHLGPGRAPQCSPTGTTVAYIGPDGLHVGALDAPSTRLVAGNLQGFTWSPNGSRIACVNSSGALDAVEVRTGAKTELAANATSAAVRWSEDGARVYFVTGQGSFAVVSLDGAPVRPFGPATTRASGIEIAPRDAHIALVHDGVVTVVTPANSVAWQAGAGLNPSWSPDGSRLAFVRDGNLLVADVASGDIRALSDAKSDVVYRFPYLQDPPIWRPDGSALIAASMASSIERSLFVTETGTGVVRLELPVRNPVAPAWSPDGRSIAFATEGAAPTVMVVDRELERVRTVAPNGSEPEWSPDGSRIAYVGGSKPRFTRAPNVGNAIFVVGVDGRGRRRVASGEVWSPAWSPDGAQLAFARSVGGGRTALYVQKLAGGLPRKVFDADVVGENSEPGEVVSISWSPTDKRRLAFRLTSFVSEKYYGTDEDEVVVIVLRRNRGARVVSRMPASTSVTWAPDGRFLLHGGKDDSFHGGYPYESFLPPLTDNSFRITRPDGHRVAGFTVPQRASSPSWQPLCTRHGSGSADRIRGSSRADLLCGLGGNDVITGGQGGDRIFGEDGDDTIGSRDGVFDVVGCGSGADTVRADENDLVGSDCERIDRR